VVVEVWVGVILEEVVKVIVVVCDLVCFDIVEFGCVVVILVMLVVLLVKVLWV